MTYPSPAQGWVTQQQTALLAPSAPQYVTSAAFDSGAVVYWNHPGDHGVTSFTITPYITGVAQATSAVNGNMRQATITGLANSTAYTFSVHATNSNGSSGESAQSGANTPLANLIFGDDFNGPAGPGTTGLSPCWTVVSRNGDQSNSETQWFLPSQVALDGSSHVTLTFAAGPHVASQYQDSTPGNNPPYSGGAGLNLAYLSGAIQMAYPGGLAATNGMAVSGFSQPGFNWTYGKIQVSMQAPNLGGGFAWPAIWMLGAQCQYSNQYNTDNVGTCSWDNPGSEEIDIAEWTGGAITTYFMPFFTSAPAGSGTDSNSNPSTTVTNPSTTFHTYEVDWSAGNINWLLDSVSQTTTANAGVPSTPQFFIAQIASRGTVTPLTQPVMSIDWVRVFHN